MSEVKDRFTVRALAGDRVLLERQFRDRLAALRFADRELSGGREVTLLPGGPLEPPRLFTSDMATVRRR